MSYTYSNEIKYSDTPDLDAFGRLRVSQITTLLDIKHLFDKTPLLVDEKINGAATSIWGNTAVNMTVTNNLDFVIRQSFESAPYQSGKSQLFEASFGNFQLENDVIKRVGYFTANNLSPFNSSLDGFFIESDGVNDEVSFQLWKNGVSIFKSLSTSWLTTDYDPSLISWDKTQLMFCDFQWLGVGRIRFSMVIDGIPRVFATHTGINDLSDVYMDKPNKPIRYEIRSAGSSGSFKMICSGVSMEGSLNHLFKTIGIENYTERTLLTSGVTYPLLGVRLGAGYIGSSARISGGDILQTTNDNYFVTVQRSPVLSGAASWNSATGSPVEYSQGTGALTVTTPGYIMRNYLGKSGALGTDNYSTPDSVFSLGHGIDGTPTEFWLCITPLAANSKFRSTMNLEYFS